MSLTAGGFSDSPGRRNFRLVCARGERVWDLAEPVAHMGSDSSGTHYKSWVAGQQGWLFCQLSSVGCDLDVIHTETVECKDPGFP